MPLGTEFDPTCQPPKNLILSFWWQNICSLRQSEHFLCRPKPKNGSITFNFRSIVTCIEFHLRFRRIATFCGRLCCYVRENVFSSISYACSCLCRFLCAKRDWLNEEFILPSTNRKLPKDEIDCIEIRLSFRLSWIFRKTENDSWQTERAEHTSHAAMHFLVRNVWTYFQAGNLKFMTVKSSTKSKFVCVFPIFCRTKFLSLSFARNVNRIFRFEANGVQLHSMTVTAFIDSSVAKLFGM